MPEGSPDTAGLPNRGVSGMGRVGPGPASGDDSDGAASGLSWCWELDYEQLLAALDGRPGHAGLVGRVTIIISEYFLNPASSDQLNDLGSSAKAAGNLAALLGVTLHAAALAAAQVKHSQMADANSGGCAHHRAAAGYRPPPNLREYITARDLTCRFITCRQPAWRADLDQTIPWDQGGRTCSCNLGGLCRFHHRLKQHLGWSLTQSAPGIFTWTTPTGRAYTTAPDRHL